MASAYFGFNFGADYSPDKITESASASGSTDVELRIDLTTPYTRARVTELVEGILRRINDGRQTILKL
jgi:hypothetical protein